MLQTCGDESADQGRPGVARSDETGDDNAWWRHFPWGNRGRLALGSLAGAAGLFALLYELSRHAVSANSDSATVALEGQAMLHGNVLLNGWTISLDSFWSIDAIVNAFIVGVFGLRDSIVNIVPALLAVTVILFGVVLAGWSFDRRGRVAAGVVVFVLLGLPSHALSYFFLQGPWHVGTALWSLFAFFGLRNGRFGWGWAVAVVLLGLGLLGDLQILALGVVPVFVAGAVAMARTRSWRRGLPTLLVAPAACVLAVIVREVALHIGTFTYQESHHTAKLKTLQHNVGHLWHWGAALFGIVNGPYGGPAIPDWFSAAHVIGLLAVTISGLLALWLLIRGAAIGADRTPRQTVETSESWRLDDLLVLGTIGDLGVFGAMTLSNNILYARYLTAAVIFSALLSARMAARAMAYLPRGRPQAVVLAAVFLLLCAFALQVSEEFNAPPPTQPIAALDEFLVSHHLRLGIGDYWAASIATLESRGDIEIRPVVANFQQLIVPDGRQASGAWYREEKFSFLVYEKLPYGRVDTATIAKTFGAPEHLYRVGDYFIATWSHPLTLSKIPFPPA